VAFEVIPAIDVAGGRLVRMSRQGTVPLEAFGGDPLAAATAFVESGAARLHVVDVDLATTGEPANLGWVRRLAALGVPVQASGGVTAAAQVEALFEAGADRVVLGSAALDERPVAERLLATHGPRLCVGIEADGARIRPRGAEGRELPLWETLVWLSGLDVTRYLFTEVGRVGELAGPDLDGIWALATHAERPVLAAGGVRSVDDVRAVADLGGSVEGVVVGRALHEGLDLVEALSATA
jgi:phosphoribosylformimino-5-aminoimidazole carboxamide ribonucleotide (ProFAR) isomerase